MTYREIHVFGGANGIGRWFTEKVFLNKLPDVHVYDIDHSALTRLPSETKRIPLPKPPEQPLYEEIISGIKPGDWVMFAVPVHILPSLASSLCPLLPQGCLLLDFSSVKKEPLEVLCKSAPIHAEILGIHPLFGPLISSPVGQIIAFTPASNNGTQSSHFRELLKSVGFLVSEVDAQEHDEAMAFVQALTHFAYLSFAQAIVSGAQSLAKLSNLRTPPFHFLSAFAGRILSGSPATYINIQRTPAARRIRNSFLNAASRLDEDFNSEDIQVAINAFEAIREPLSGSEISECTSISRLATDTLDRFERQLHRLRERRAVVIFSTSDNNKLHIGCIEEVRTDDIIFSESFKKLNTIDGSLYAIALNDTAVLNYRRKGIEFGVPSTTIFKKRKIIFLSDTEYQEWLTQNLLYLKRTAMFNRYGSFEPEILEQLIPQSVQNVRKVLFLHLYRRRGEPERFTIEIEFRPDVNFDKILKDVKDFLTIFHLTNGT
jgi:prephenate dehydrogenase